MVDRGCLFTIIMPTYNRGHLIKEALESIFRQTLADYEIIVVDDGSTDGTDEILAIYADKVRIFWQANGGPAKARNYGLRKARGRYITFLDSDDRFFPWTLATFKQVIDRFEKPAFILGKRHKFTQEDELAGVKAEPLAVERWDSFLEAAPAEYPISILSAIRADVLRRADGFVQRRVCSEGHDLYLRIGTERGFIFVQAPVLDAYRQHSTGDSLSQDAAPLYEGARLLLERERRGDYPGGDAQSLDRSIFLARSVGYSLRRCFALGEIWRGYDLYVRALPHYLRAGYWRAALKDSVTPVERLQKRAKRLVKRNSSTSSLYKS